MPTFEEFLSDVSMEHFKQIVFVLRNGDALYNAAVHEDLLKLVLDRDGPEAAREFIEAECKPGREVLEAMNQEAA